MAEFCPAPHADAPMVRGLLQSVDCNVQSLTQASYAGLMQGSGAFAAALTALLTVYIALIGWRLMLGRGPVTVTDFALNAIKLGAVLALATQWSVYQTLVYRFLFEGPQQIADAVLQAAQGGGGTHVFDALQRAFDVMTAEPPTPSPQAVQALGVAPSPAALAAARTAGIGQAISQSGFDSILLTIAAAILLLSTLGVLLAAKIVLGLLLALGPLFIALMLFDSTRGLFEGWLRASLGFALAPLTATLALSLALAMLAPSLRQLEALRDFNTPAPGVAFGVLVLAIVFAAVAAGLLIAGGIIAGGFRLPALTLAARGETQAAAAPHREAPVLPRAARTAAAIAAQDRRASTGATYAASSFADRRTTLAPAASAPGPEPGAADGRLGQAPRRHAGPRATRTGARSSQ